MGRRDTTNAARRGPVPLNPRGSPMPCSPCVPCGDAAKTLLAYLVTRRSACRVLIWMLFMIFPAAGPSPSPLQAAESGHHVDAAAAVAGGAS